MCSHTETIQRAFAAEGHVLPEMKIQTGILANRDILRHLAETQRGFQQISDST